MVVRECTSGYAREGLRRPKRHRMGPWHKRLYSSLGSYAFPFPDPYSDGIPNADSSCDSNCYAHGHGYADSSRYRYRHTHSYSYCNSDSNSNTDLYANPNGYTRDCRSYGDRGQYGAD